MGPPWNVVVSRLSDRPTTLDFIGRASLARHVPPGVGRWHTQIIASDALSSTSTPDALSMPDEASREQSAAPMKPSFFASNSVSRQTGGSSCDRVERGLGRQDVPAS